MTCGRGCRDVGVLGEFAQRTAESAAKAASAGELLNGEESGQQDGELADEQSLDGHESDHSDDDGEDGEDLGSEQHEDGGELLLVQLATSWETGKGEWYQYRT